MDMPQYLLLKKIEDIKTASPHFRIGEIIRMALGAETSIDALGTMSDDDLLNALNELETTLEN